MKLHLPPRIGRLIRPRTHWSLRKKILLNLLLFAGIPYLVISIFTYRILASRVSTELRTTVDETLERTAGDVARAVDSYYLKSNYVLNAFFRGSSFANADFDRVRNILKILDLNYNMDSLLIEFSNRSIVTNAFAIYLRDYKGLKGKYIEDMSDIDTPALVDTILARPLSLVTWSPTPKVDRLGDRFLTFYRCITTVTVLDGILEVNIPYEDIQTILEKEQLPYGGGLVHLGIDGKILSATGGAAPDARRFILMPGPQKLPDGSTLLAAIPRAKFLARLKTTILTLAALFFMLVTLIVVVAVISSRRITKALDGFITYLKSNDEVLLNERAIELQLEDDLQPITGRFTELIHRMNTLYGDLLKERNQNNLLTIELLQSRVNPHLLYNSLSVIKWALLKQHDERTADIIEELSRYYRLALGRGRDVIRVAEELDMLHHYVRIMQFNHSSAYELRVEVDDAASHSWMLKHLLQPVVENAILHGLNGKQGVGIITIRGAREGDDLAFEISDNGRGMDRETLERVQRFDTPSDLGGYGMRNVAKRIALSYGDGCGITLTSVQNEGTTVRIRVKALSPAEGEAANRGLRDSQPQRFTAPR